MEEEGAVTQKEELEELTEVVLLKLAVEVVRAKKAFGTLWEEAVSCLSEVEVHALK